MIYYRCYDAQADRNRKWSTTCHRWWIALSNHKERVKTVDETCEGLLMHSDGDTVRFWMTVYASCKPLRKTELPKPCQDFLDKYIAGYETEEVI